MFAPAGTCINNTSVMMFKKGSFEIGGPIYPVAIKVTHQYLSFMHITHYKGNYGVI